MAGGDSYVAGMSDEPALVRLERRDDGVAVVTLDNPKVNALSGAVVAKLTATAEELIADPPGAVVVTGGERIFAAGADITGFVGLGPTGGEAARRRHPGRDGRHRGHPAHGDRGGRRATRWAAGVSWRWPATSGLPPRRRSSASPRSCSASSRGRAARSACPGSSGRRGPRT